MSTYETVYGYDGSGYTVGDRVEIHPGTDLWMRGARYGTVKRLSLTPKDRVHVELDKLPGRTFAGSADTFPRGAVMNVTEHTTEAARLAFLRAYREAGREAIERRSVAHAAEVAEQSAEYREQAEARRAIREHGKVAP